MISGDERVEADGDVRAGQPCACGSSSHGPEATGETHLCEEIAAQLQLRRVRLSANRESLREPAGSIAIATNPIMTALPRPRTKRRIAIAPMQPVGGLDYGGPAVMEPWLVRPETLRRHLSVGLPCLNPAYRSSTRESPTVAQLTLLQQIVRGS